MNPSAVEVDRGDEIGEGAVPEGAVDEAADFSMGSFDRPVGEAIADGGEDLVGVATKGTPQADEGSETGASEAAEESREGLSGDGKRAPLEDVAEHLLEGPGAVKGAADPRDDREPSALLGEEGPPVAEEQEAEVLEPLGAHVFRCVRRPIVITRIGGS